MTRLAGGVTANPARSTKTFDSLKAMPEGWRNEFVYVTPRSIDRAVRRALIVGAVSGAFLIGVIALVASLGAVA